MKSSLHMMKKMCQLAEYGQSKFTSRHAVVYLRAARIREIISCTARTSRFSNIAVCSEMILSLPALDSHLVVPVLLRQLNEIRAAPIGDVGYDSRLYFQCPTSLSSLLSNLSIYLWAFLRLSDMRGERLCLLGDIVLDSEYADSCALLSLSAFRRTLRDLQRCSSSRSL
ncbi:hypothetical protein Tco_1476668 [Tanacetum coccineum]